MGQAPSLPDDAVADVLRRLAPRDLAASRRVCKTLRRVVDGHRLLRADLLPLKLGGIFLNFFELRSATQFLSRPTTGAAVSGRLGYTLDACHPDYDFQPVPYVLDHCNGLLLLHHCVVNPATQQWAPLPPAPDPPKPAPSIKHFWKSRYLVFDPMLSPNHFDLLIMPEISFMEECEEFEWPPSTLILPVFSSKIGSWEKKTFYGDGEAAGTVPGLVGVRLDCNERQSVYWRGSLYICCENCFILRISLADNSYRVIRLPTRLSLDDSQGDQQFYLGKSTKGIYCASRITSHKSHLQVWFLNDLNEWVLKHDKDIFPVQPNIDYGNPCDGPWILQQFDYDEHADEDDSVVEDNREAVEKEKFEAIVKQGKFEWDSDNDNVLEPGSSCGRTNTFFLGFHPFKEVVFVTLWDRVLAYHLPSSKLQDLGKLFPEFYVDGPDTYWHTQVQESFLYTPCWLGELPEKLN
ncbi:uncharacterized protein LOC119270583 [Triticum dicoccoides]|uniref:uncharacterized protein LOC119270583 n=1 Tax=Triticum dicoccoides TaxID=85692 RepID=UPI00188F6D0C|nr:uncharacterized protein LOC119270583 [Triticum dicoccoides]